MAVLWRSMESSGTPDEGYQDDTVVLTAKGGMLDKNTLFEKHVRVSANMPSDTQRKAEVKRVWGDRRKGDGSIVVGQRGKRNKKDIYGTLRPDDCTIMFATLQGFQETNAWIEKNITKSNGKAKVPILGGCVVVSWKMDTFEFDTLDAGFLVLGIRVGKAAFVEFGSSD